MLTIASARFRADSAMNSQEFNWYGLFLDSLSPWPTFQNQLQELMHFNNTEIFLLLVQLSEMQVRDELMLNL